MTPPNNKTMHEDYRKRQRVVLMSRRALFSLTIVTLSLLWILQPNRDLLLDFIDNADDPTIAIAFLTVLQERYPDSHRLELTLATQYAKLNQYKESLEQLSPLSKFTDHKQLIDAQNLYADNLFNLILEKDTSAKNELKQYLSTLTNKITYDQSEQFAKYAIQMSEPGLAYHLLENQTPVDHQQLLSLAQQAELPKQAQLHSLALYKAQPSQINFKNLLSIYRSQQKWREGEELIKRQLDKQCASLCLQQSINFLRSADKPILVAQLSQQKAQQSYHLTDWLQASERSAEIGDISNAAFWLAKTNEVSPSIKLQTKLHDYYVWLGDINNALKITEQLLAKQSSIPLLWQGVKEAHAATNLIALSNFYFKLAQHQQLDKEKLEEWVNFNDKAHGAKATLLRLEALHKQLPLNTFLWFQLARFYQFVGEPQKATLLWDKIPLEGLYNFSDVYYFAKSFVALGETGKALEILNKYTDQKKMTTSQLAILQDLATYYADRPLQRTYQLLSLQLGDTSLDPYLLIATHKDLDDSDLEAMWLYYDQTKSILVLSALLRHFLKKGKPELINKAGLALEQNHQNQKTLEVQLLRVQLLLFQKNHTRAKNMLTMLMRKHPDNPNVQENALWLALITQDKAWLKQVYWSIAPYKQQTSDLFQALAYSAQLLGEYAHANIWYNNLDREGLASAADYLSWANMSVQRGNEAKALQLRWKVLKELRTQLKALQGGEISYRSLLSIFVSPAYANSQLHKDLQQEITASDVESLIQGQSLSGIQKIALLQAHTSLSNSDYSDTVQLAIALSQKNHALVQTIVHQSTTLTDIERVSALDAIGKSSTAWLKGQRFLNHRTNMQDLYPLKNMLAASHNNHSHGVLLGQKLYDTWQVSEQKFEYYRPFSSGHYTLSYRQQSGETDTLEVNNYKKNLLTLDWRNSSIGSYQLLNLGLQVREGFGQTNFAQYGSINWQSSPKISHQINFKHQMPSQQSENLFLFGNEDRLNYQFNWQPTRYENMSIGLSRALFHSEFSEPIGKQWHSSIRFNQQLNFAPNWQLYTQYDYQNNTLDNRDLAKLSSQLGLIQPITPEAFLSPKYSHLSIGNQIFRGQLGTPGRDIPEFRYWLDTGIGYNFVEQAIDYSINIGLGTRVFGNDELFLQGDWQSADQNSRENLILNLGYFIDF